MSCPAQAIIGETLTFTIQTTGVDGEPSDPTGNVNYSVYEDETSTALLTGTMAKMASQTGFYSENIDVTSDNGFEKYKSYTVRITSTISGFAVVKLYSFTCLGVSDVAGLGTSEDEAISLSDVKTHLRVDLDDDDALINNIITAVRKWTENVLGLKLITQTVIEYFDAFPAGDIVPKWSPLVEVTSIQYVDTAGDTQDWEDSYRLDTYNKPARISLAYGESYPATRNITNAVILTYTAGFGADSSYVPEGIKQGMLLFIAHLYEHRESVTEYRLEETPMAVQTLLLQKKVTWF